MSSPFKFYFLILLVFSIIQCGEVEKVKSDSKYENPDYLKFFRMPNSLFSYSSSGAELRELKNAFDEKYDTVWISLGRNGEKFKNLQTNVTYDSLINDVVFTFSKTVEVDRMIYQSYSPASCPGFGYPNELKIFCKKKDTKGQLSDDNEDYELIDDILSETTEEKVVFKFKSKMKCDQIKVEWTKISTECGISSDGAASAKEIMLLLPETAHLNEKIIDFYDPNDYTHLTIAKDYKKESLVDDLKEEVKELSFSDYAVRFVERFEAIFNGSLKFDPKREFTTDPKSKSSPLYQRGDVDHHGKRTLKMRRAVTNRQPTGIYGRPNEIITFYITAGNEDPLPTLRFTQFLGTIARWLGNTIILEKGIKSYTFNDFDISTHTIKTNSGGPIYLVNPYTPEEQSSKVKVYIEGGVIFPLFRIGEDEEEFKDNLSEYILDYRKNKNTYLDITEFYGNHIMVTTFASKTYDIYKNDEKGPQKNLVSWDNYMKKLLKFDGIQFDKNEPYYNEMNNYLNVHFRLTQPDTIEIANYEYIAMFTDDWIAKTIDFNSEEEIGWEIPHQIGSMIDLNERVVRSTSNDMIPKYITNGEGGDDISIDNDHYENKLKFLTPDDDNEDNIQRGCKLAKDTKCNGFFLNEVGNYLIWWDLESLHPGYWAKLENMYRYNKIDTKGLTKTEKFVYFSNLILGMDLGYYFTRWGYYMEYDQKTFNYNDTSETYQKLMEAAVKNETINSEIKKKFWYLDNKEYNYINDIGKGCYKNSDDYDVQIEEINKEENGYEIVLPKINCPGHLGFEVYEGERLIGFSTDSSFIDTSKYGKNVTPQYTIIAYDRLLDTSNRSHSKSP